MTSKLKAQSSKSRKSKCSKKFDTAHERREGTFHLSGSRTLLVYVQQHTEVNVPLNHLRTRTVLVLALYVEVKSNYKFIQIILQILGIINHDSFPCLLPSPQDHLVLSVLASALYHLKYPCENMPIMYHHSLI